MSINDIIPIFDVVLPPGAALGRELHGEIFNFWALFHLVRLEGRLAFCALWGILIHDYLESLGIPFDSAVVICLEKDFSFNFILRQCVENENMN